MAFQTNLLKRITICPNCRGWGVMNPKEPIDKHLDCPKCEKDGVYVKESGETLIFDMPTFVDFGGRRMVRVMRMVMIAVVVLFFILVIVGVWYLLRMIGAE